MNEVPSYFLFDENEYLSEFESRVKKVSKSGGDSVDLEDELKERFKLFLKFPQRGSWEKVLKRYYTYFKRLSSDYLLERVQEDLVDRPSVDEKIHDYLLGIEFRPGWNQDKIIL